MDKIKSVFLGLVLVSGLFLFGCTENSNGITNNSTYTLQDVGVHNIPTDCWVAMDGNVYDITQMIQAMNVNNQHNVFAQDCGKDATLTLQNMGPTGKDFNRSRPDFNGIRPDFNGARPDFNSRVSDFNGARQVNGFRGGRGLTQYYIGKLIN